MPWQPSTAHTRLGHCGRRGDQPGRRQARRAHRREAGVRAAGPSARQPLPREEAAGLRPGPQTVPAEARRPRVTPASGCTPRLRCTTAPQPRSPAAAHPRRSPRCSPRAVRQPPTPGTDAAQGRLDQPAVTGGPSYIPYGRAMSFRPAGSPSLRTHDGRDRSARRISSGMRYLAVVPGATDPRRCPGGHDVSDDLLVPPFRRRHRGGAGVMTTAPGWPADA